MKKMKEEKTTHEKAIRLVEGGVVEIDGHSVKMGVAAMEADACDCCHMDCLCHRGNAICELCEECDSIAFGRCFLILVTSER